MKTEIFTSHLSLKSRQYHPKERVLGLRHNGKQKAYPFAELSLLEGNILHDEFAGEKLTIRFDRENQDGEITDQDGNVLDMVNGFWFAWYAFYQDTEIYKAEK